MASKTPPQTQQDFLQEVKAAMGMTWDELAEASGIKARALKTYRMPDSSKDHRTLPDLARRSLTQLRDARRPSNK